MVPEHDLWRSDSELIVYPLCNNTIMKHSKFIPLHGTEALMKMDILMQLCYSCLTLASLTLFSICFKTKTHLGFGKYNAIDCFVIWDLLHYGSPNAKVARPMPVFDVNAWKPVVTDPIFNYFAIFNTLVNKNMETCTHKNIFNKIVVYTFTALRN